MTAPQGCGDVNAHLQLQKKRGPTTIVLQGSGAVREKIDEDCELLTRRTHLILPVFETM